MGEVGTWVRLPWIWSRVVWNANGHSILRKVSQTDFPRKVQEEPHRHSWGSWEILWGREEFWLSAPGGRLVLQLEVWVLYWDLGRPPKSYTKHHRISVSWEREKQYLYDTKQRKSFSCSKAELTVLCRVITEQTKQAPELREELSPLMRNLAGPCVTEQHWRPQKPRTLEITQGSLWSTHHARSLLGLWDPFCSNPSVSAHYPKPDKQVIEDSGSAKRSVSFEPLINLGTFQNHLA